MKRIEHFAWPFAVATVLFLLALGVGLANGPEIGRDAGMVFPLKSGTVALLAESVYVALPESYEKGSATCTYRLCNLSDKNFRTEMAFVTNSPNYSEPGFIDFMYRDARFVVIANQRELPVRYEPLDQERWRELIGSAPDSLPV